MKIISLEVQDVLKLKTVSITPNGSAVVIGGKNAQGKTSVLNCIMSALGGKKYIAEEAVRKGEKKGSIILDLGKYVVTRTFTESGGGAVTVANSDGARFTSPQNVLDGLLSSISFDPLSFSRMDTKGQLEILKAVSGVDTSKLDIEYADVFTSRSNVNRDVKRLEGQLDGMTIHEDAPSELVVVSALTTELEKSNKINLDNKTKRDLLKTRKTEKADLERGMTDLEKELEDLQTKIELKKKAVTEAESAVKKGGKIVGKLKDIDTTEITKKMNSAEETNQKVRDNIQHKETTTELKKEQKSSDKKTARLQKIKDEKVKLIAKSDLPINDLLFDEDGVTFQGLPFDQASEAEKLRVSVSLGLAMNPDLKVMLIRDGSLLDEDNLALIAKMAEDADGQVWIERVGTGKEMTVIMEDGEIVKPKKSKKK